MQGKVDTPLFPVYRTMQTIWFNPRKSALTKNLRRILGQWRQAIEEYQKETGDLGYGWYYTEKSNFGFFLKACAELGMHFLPEFTMERRGRRQRSGLGRPDCWIRMKEGAEAYFEVKKAYNSLDGKSKNTVFNALRSAEHQLKSLKYLESSSYRVALCFITLGRKAESKRKILPYEKALSKYMKELRESGEIDFYSATSLINIVSRRLTRETKEISKTTIAIPPSW